MESLVGLHKFIVKVVIIETSFSISIDFFLKGGTFFYLFSLLLFL